MDRFLTFLRRVRAGTGGFSLSELMVVLVLLGVILGVAFAGLQVVYKGNEVSDRAAVFSSEVGAPLSVMEKIFTQNIVIENPTAYTVEVLTDRNNDNVAERHYYAANTNGTLTESVYLTDSSLVDVGSPVEAHTWSRLNVNRKTGYANTPLFTYLDASGTQLALTDPTTVEDNARSVVVNMKVTYKGKEWSDSRRMFFRNR